MKIELLKMKLENFKSIKERTIDFAKKTEIKGQNAVGKTTIADAFTWVLFNKMSDGTQADKIRPHDESGVDIDFIDISVEIKININGKEVAIKKVQKQKWTKPRGQEEKRFDGNYNEYEVNTIPKTERDFRAYFDNIIAEDVFRYSTNANSFMQLKPKERRAQLFELVSDITDFDVLEKNKELASIKDMLTEFTVEELISRNAKALKEYNKKLVEIPARIDEVAKSIVAIDISSLELHKNALLEKIAKTEEMELDASKASEEIEKISKEFMDAKFRLGEIERNENEVLIAKRKELQEKKDNADMEFSQVTREYSNLEKNIQILREERKKKEKQRNQICEAYMEVSKRRFESASLFCPTCGQEYKEEKKQELMEHFEKNKNKKLEELNQQGFSLKKDLEVCNASIKEYESQVERIKQGKIECMKVTNDTMKQLENLPKEVDCSEIEEYKALKEKIKGLESSLSSMDADAGYKSQLKIKKAGLKEELEKVQENLNQAASNIKAEERITELQLQQQEIAQKIACVEKEQYLLEKFNKAKVEMLTDKINEHFSIVKWKLFEQQINGGYKEICEPTIDGTLYSNGLNKGHRVAAELDIIATLQRINGVSVPVFLDDCERINTWNIPKMECQLITLTRTDDLEMKVEVA